MTPETAALIEEVRRRWSTDGGMGNERSADDYTDAGCRVLAEHAFRDIAAVVAALALQDTGAATEDGAGETEPRCEWFSWIGGHVCDQCGKPPSKHTGLRWIDRDKPFALNGEDHDLRVPWSDYGPARRLNVPLLTMVMGDALLASLHAAAPESPVVASASPVPEGSTE